MYLITLIPLIPHNVPSPAGLRPIDFIFNFLMEIPEHPGSSKSPKYQENLRFYKHFHDLWVADEGRGPGRPRPQNL